MRKTFCYILGGQLAAISIPAFAQEAVPAREPPATATHDHSAMKPPTAEQMAAIGSWPPERQAAFRQWPHEVQSYYWQLSPERQAVFWRLQDKDRLAIAAMDEAGRTASWARIDAQLAAEAGAAPEAKATPPAEEEAPEATEPKGRT